MMLCSTSIWAPIRSWLRDYDKIQAGAVFLIYIQIGCALIGSLGALFNGVLLINLVIALFALIAIESSSQSLGRTYAVLLFAAVLLDISWFILFSHEIWNISTDNYGQFFVFSLKLALCMQIIGFSMRLLSSFLWIQMYRLGPSSMDGPSYREADFDLCNSFMNPSTHCLARQSSDSEDILGGSIYDPAYYSSLFQEPCDNGYAYGGDKQNSHDDGGSTSAAEPSQLKLCIGRSFQVNNDNNTENKPQRI